MSIKSVSSLVNQGSYLYDFINEECGSDPIQLDHVLKNMTKNMSDYMLEETPWDRQEVFDCLNRLTTEKGNLVCILGAKSTGKTLVLKKHYLAKENRGKVIYIDMRRGYSSIVKGLINVITKERDNFSKLYEALNNFLKKALTTKLQLPKGDIPIAGEIVLNLQTLFKETSISPIEILDDLLNEMILQLPKDTLTLIIDEANIPLSIDEDSTSLQVDQVKEALALFTSLTKAANKMNIILVSSDHVFPYRLGNPKLKFNLQNINHFLFFGEVPPNEMYKLLTEELKFSVAISLELINLYGGHIYSVYQSILRLDAMRSDFYTFDADFFQDVLICYKEVEDKDKLLSYYRQLVEKGFMPLGDRDDPIAEILSKNNVAAVIKKSRLNYGLPSSFWVGTHNYGLVPSSQSLRLIMAQFLDRHESSLSSKE